MSTINTDSKFKSFEPYQIVIMGKNKIKDEDYVKIAVNKYEKIECSIYNIDFHKIPKCVYILHCLYLKNEYIPKHITHVITNYNYLDLKNLPNLIYLKVMISTSQYSNNDFDYLPITLQTLIIYGVFNGYLDNLPVNLKTLEIKTDFNGLLNNLPSGLENLVIESRIFDKELNQLPLSLKSLDIKTYLGYKVYCKIRSCPNIIELKLSMCDIDIIPNSVEKIHIYQWEIQDLIKNLFPKIPKTLKTLTLSRGLECKDVIQYIENNFTNLDVDYI